MYYLHFLHQLGNRLGNSKHLTFMIMFSYKDFVFNTRNIWRCRFEYKISGRGVTVLNHLICVDIFIFFYKKIWTIVSSFPSTVKGQNLVKRERMVINLWSYDKANGKGDRVDTTFHIGLDIKRGKLTNPKIMMKFFQVLICFINPLSTTQQLALFVVCI